MLEYLETLGLTRARPNIQSSRSAITADRHVPPPLIPGLAAAARATQVPFERMPTQLPETLIHFGANAKADSAANSKNLPEGTPDFPKSPFLSR